MMKLLGTDYDAYAALFGHEIGHIVKKHIEQHEVRRGFLEILGVIANLAIAAKTGVNANSLTDLGVNIVDNIYNRDQEREADRLGLIYMIKAGFDPSGAVRLQ